MAGFHLYDICAREISIYLWSLSFLWAQIMWNKQLYVVIVMNKKNIELRARDLQVNIWKQRNNLWPDGHPCLTRMFDPTIAAHILDIQYEHVEELGGFGLKNDKFEVAGFINRSYKSIVISKRFPRETMRFTGAHEIGHWLLHPNETMHRDRPIKGLTHNTYQKSSIEAEADYFAACFLMPKRLVTNCLKETFNMPVPFQINDTAAFYLAPNDPDSILNKSSFDVAMTIASATSFGSMHFNSLAQQFGVSVSTMAIRLVELNLINTD